MSTATDTPNDILRARMVERIETRGPLSEPVKNAMLAVERHQFVPDAPREHAYADNAVITHTFPDGTHLSCASEPGLVARMLDALEVQPGNTILEIGAGTGYNAALLSDLAGPDGQVTTVDINPDVARDARTHLHDQGFTGVHVITRDGALGAPEHRPYDRIIVTVGAWDIPRAWWDQLAPDGRLVVPLRWRATTYAVAFIKRGDHWESDGLMLCGFVPFLGQDGERSATIDVDDLVTLHYDLDQTVDPGALRGVLTMPRTAVWSDTTVRGDESFDGVWLRLSAADRRTVRVQAAPDAVASGLCEPAIPTRSPALVDGGSLAYFAMQRSGPGRWKLGAIGHGPAGVDLATQLTRQIDAWGQDRAAQPRVTAYPADTAASTGDPNAIIKPDTVLHVTY